MIIKRAEFSISSPTWAKCPHDGLPEYAFIGRSNVGKSSLINMLTGVKGLAKTSGRPGKTQLINHFLINNEWYLVDLPGYGYARTSKSQREGFGQMIRSYFLKREELVNTYVLIHGSVPGPAKRLVRLRDPTRAPKGANTEAADITYISTASKQGA